MQAPHRPAPQPNFVPVSFNPSRSTQSNGVSGGASVEAAAPLTTKLVIIWTLPKVGNCASAVPSFSQSSRDKNGMTMGESGATLTPALPYRLAIIVRANVHLNALGRRGDQLGPILRPAGARHARPKAHALS